MRNFSSRPPALPDENGLGMRDKGGRTTSEMRELTTAVNEVAILENRSKSQRKMRKIINNAYIKPSETSNTLSLRTNSINVVKRLRSPRLTVPAALSKAIVSVDNQGLSFGIGGVVGVSYTQCYLDKLGSSSSMGIFRFFGIQNSGCFWQISIPHDCPCHFIFYHVQCFNIARVA